MTPSILVQEQSKKVLQVLAGEQPLLKRLHEITMQELAKTTPNLTEVTEGILRSGDRTVRLSSELINLLLESMSVEELQPQLDYIFTVCLENKSEEHISALEPELAELVRSHLAFTDGLNNEITRTYGPKAMEKALAKTHSLEDFIDSVKDIPGFEEMARKISDDGDALATEMAPVVEGLAKGDII
jgi:hypothetical protein